MDVSLGDRVFPDSDSLCECCGYPIKGLAIHAQCPECGQAVAESSPDKRHWPVPRGFMLLTGYLSIARAVLLSPSRHFRQMRVHGHKDDAIYFMLTSAALAAGLSFFALNFSWLFVDPGMIVDINFGSAFLFCLFVFLTTLLLTYIEVLGVVTFSRRRGWRVPFASAERVCCYASVGWLPGVIVAGVGVSLVDMHGLGRPWFEHLLGLVRVGWLLYGVLFIVAMLWFETLVWIGVRRVRYANAWGDAG